MFDFQGACINIIYLCVAKSVNEVFSLFKSLFTVNTVHILDKTSTKIKVLVTKTNAVFVIWLTTSICAVEAMYYNWMLDKDETMLITVFLKQHTNCSMYVLIYYYPFLTVCFKVRSSLS